MDLNVSSFSDETYVIEMGADDTAEDMRRKVASAVGLPEDSFGMSFGDEAMEEGADMTQLSAGDTIILTKSKKFEAIAELHALGETDLSAQRLETVREPAVACLLLQAEVATAIPDKFLRGSSLTRLDLSAVSTVTQVGNDFLEGCSSLTSIDISSLSRTVVLGDNFLRGCSSLTAIDLSSFNNLISIGDCFLHDCSSLATISLPSLSNITTIRGCFLSRCGSLTAVDLSSLHNVTHIGNYFLGRCTSVRSIDLSSLRMLRKVGNYFLFQCRSLTEVDVSSLCNVKALSGCFMQDCSSLTAIDLSPLHSVTNICESFLARCSSLTEIDLSALHRVARVAQTRFLLGCEGLKRIHLTGCSGAVARAVKDAELSEFVQDRPKRSRDGEDPLHTHKRQRLLQ